MNNVEIDLYSDWINILKNELTNLDYNIPSSDNQEQICFKYFNLKKRLLKPQPRVVLKSKEFTIPNGYEKNIENLINKIEKGDNLFPHLSTLIENLDFND